MISDWTVYGWLADGGVLCAACVRDDDSGRYAISDNGMRAYDFEDEVRLDALLSLEDTDPLGLSCDSCGEYVFEPDPEAMHAEYGHDEPEPDCELCTAVATQLEDWAAEHEAGEHAEAPILHGVNVRGGWAETVTETGCPDCERQYRPAPGQLELHPLETAPDEGVCPNGHPCRPDGPDTRACTVCSYRGAAIGKLEA